MEKQAGLVINLSGEGFPATQAEPDSTPRMAGLRHRAGPSEVQTTLRARGSAAQEPHSQSEGESMKPGSSSRWVGIGRETTGQHDGSQGHRSPL